MKKVMMTIGALVLVMAMASCDGFGNSDGGKNKYNPKGDADKFISKVCDCGNIEDDAKAEACYAEALELMNALEEKYKDDEEANEIISQAIEDCECEEAMGTLFLYAMFAGLADEDILD